MVATEMQDMMKASVPTPRKVWNRFSPGAGLPGWMNRHQAASAAFLLFLDAPLDLQMLYLERLQHYATGAPLPSFDSPLAQELREAIARGNAVGAQREGSPPAPAEQPKQKKRR